MALRHPFLLGLTCAFLWSSPALNRPAPQEPPVARADSGAAPASPTGEARPDQLTPLQARAYAEVLRLRLDSARALLAPELKRQPHDARALLLQDCADFADVVLRQDQSRYPATLAAMKQRLDQAEGLTGPWAALAVGEIRLHLAVAEICFEDEVRAAWDMRQALLHLEAAARQYPDFVPLRKSLGLCQFLVGIIPDQYRWFVRLLGLNGSIPEGLANLDRAADEANPFQTEARIFRALIQEGYFKREAPILTLTAELLQRQPDNLLFSYLRMATLRRQKQPDAALRVFRSRPTGAAYVPLYYLHHLAGDLLLYRGDYASSARENEFFLRRYAGQHYRKDTCYKLYLAAWLRHDAATASRWLVQIDEVGKGVIEEDRAAQRFFDERPTLSEGLMRARLAADGGYWKLAQRHLNAFPLAAQTPREQRAEWCYRQAKVYQGQGRTDSARFFFQRTVTVQGDAPRYFAPNAALQLGYLAREIGDRKTARQWFEKALAYDRHEYKRSIDSQAKAALAAL